MKRFFSAFMAVILLLSIFTVTASAVSSDDAYAKIKEIQTTENHIPETGVNSEYWGESGCTAFVFSVLEQIFGPYDDYDMEKYTSAFFGRAFGIYGDDNMDYYGIVYSAYGYTLVSMYLNEVGSVVGANVTSASAKELLSQARSGDVIQYKNSFTTQHTAVVEEVTAEGIRLYEFNYKHGVNSILFKWDVLCTENWWKTSPNNAGLGAFTDDDHGITLYRHINADEASTSDANPPSQETTVQPAPSFFTDVAVTSWYYDDVLQANQRGLIDGVSSELFMPDSNLTIAQAIKLAACLHQIYNYGEVTLESGQPNWYDSYVQYAKTSGIISGDYGDYNAAITREEFVRIMYYAMPESSYSVLNELTSDYIPDVRPDDTYYKEIFTLYKAGILTGSDSTGTFNPKSNIKRSEVASILTRLYDKNERIVS